MDLSKCFLDIYVYTPRSSQAWPETPLSLVGSNTEREPWLVKMMKMSGHCVFTLNGTSFLPQDSGNATQDRVKQEPKDGEQSSGMPSFGHGMAFALINYALTATTATCARPSGQVQSTSQLAALTGFSDLQKEKKKKPKVNPKRKPPRGHEVEGDTPQGTWGVRVGEGG